MGVLNALVGARPRPAAMEKSAGGAAFSLGALSSLGGAPSATGLLVSQATALTVSTVYACIRIRSGSLARCTPRVTRIDETGRVSPVKDHPLAALFGRPNRQQTWFEFAETMEAAFLLRGNAYAVKLRDGFGEVVELLPVNPDQVQLLEAGDGSLFYSVGRLGSWMMAALEGQPVIIPGEDVLHVRDLSFDVLTGVSRLGLARDTIGLAMSQERQAARWAGNGARPAGVLQTDGKLSPEAAQRLKERWETLQAGVQNTGRTAVLEHGVKWQPMQMTSVDLEFLNSRTFQIREICRWFDVPPHMVGELANLGRATVAELNADFVQRVVMDDVRRWESKLSHEFDLEAAGLGVMLDNRELLRADLKTQMDLARAGVLSGLLTQNEGRQQIGLGPLPNADVLMPPLNLAPNGSALDGRAPDGAGRPKDGQDPEPTGA